MNGFFSFFSCQFHFSNLHVYIPFLFGLRYLFSFCFSIFLFRLSYFILLESLLLIHSLILSFSIPYIWLQFNFGFLPNLKNHVGISIHFQLKRNLLATQLQNYLLTLVTFNVFHSYTLQKKKEMRKDRAQGRRNRCGQGGGRERSLPPHRFWQYVNPIRIREGQITPTTLPLSPPDLKIPTALVSRKSKTDKEGRQARREGRK